MSAESAPQTKPAPKRPLGLLKSIEISLTVVLIILLAAYLFYLRPRGEGGAAPTVFTADITVSEARVGPMREYLTVECTILPQNTVYLDAIEGGRVEKTFVEVGSMVRQGDALIQLANPNLLMDIMYREAELFQQSNNLRNTRLSMEQYKLQLNQQLSELDNQLQQQKRLYDRYKELDKDSLISKQDFEQSRDQYEYLLKRKDLMERSQRSELTLRGNQLEALEESLRRMEANLEAVKQRQENLTVRAPIGGQITSLAAQVGQSFSAGQRLGQIDVLSGFKAAAAIDEKFLSQIEVNTAGEFDYAGHTYRLIVKKIFPEVKDRKFQAELEFRGDRPQGVKRGQSLEVRVGLGELSQALILARGDFLKDTGGDWVYKLDPAGKNAVKQSIKLGRRNAEAVEILRGLQPGDRVITSSYAAFGGRERLSLKTR